MTQWLPYHAFLAGQYGGGALAIDASDNLYILYYQANPKPEYYGGQGETQITKLNSSGVEQWTRVTGGQTPFMGQKWKVHMTFTPQVVVSFTLLDLQTDTMDSFMVIRPQQLVPFCSKQMAHIVT